MKETVSSYKPAEQTDILPSIEVGTATYVKDLDGMRVAVQRGDGHVEVMVTTGLMESDIHHSFDTHNRPIDVDYLVQVRGRRPVGKDANGVSLFEGKWVPESTLELEAQSELEHYLPPEELVQLQSERRKIGHSVWESLHHAA